MIRFMRRRHAAVLAAGLGYALVALPLFTASPWIRPALSAGIFLALFTPFVFWTCVRALRLPAMRAWLRGGALAGLLLVSMYASFASFGYRLFLAGDYVEISPGRIGVLLLGAAWFAPVIFMLLCALERLCARMAVRAVPSARSARHAFWSVWGAALACQAVVVCSFWPGGFALDSILQLYQALGLSPLNDWHPVLHTLLHRFFLLFFDHPGFLVAVQSFFFTLVTARAALTAYRFGARLRMVLLGTAVFCLLPNQALSNIALLKDFPFTYALVWGALLFAELAKDVNRLRKPGFVAQLALCMFLIAGLRHNGILPMLFMAFALCVIAARHWKRLKAQALACALIPILALAGFKGPVYRLLDVEPNTASTYTTMFCGVASCLNKGKALSDGAMETLERAMTLDEWRSYYSRFEGHDQYLYHLPNGMNLMGYTAKEAFGIYFEALARYPDIVIKDRLDGANLLWDVTQPEESYNTDYTDHAFIEPDVGLVVTGAQTGEAYRNPSLIARAYRWASLFHFPGEKRSDQLHDMLLWRSGAWLILLCVLILYWLKLRLRGMWLCAVPLFGNLAAMALVLYHQSFRYVYFVQPLVLCLLLLTVETVAQNRRSNAASSPPEGQSPSRPFADG